jgi:alpha-beta hydrolase superfamily lysophospholipase
MTCTRRWKVLGALFMAAMIVSAIMVWLIGGTLVAPANHPVGQPPASLHAENVTFPSDSGTTVHGWFVAGQPGKGAIVLMHGVHADRETLVARAEFLSREGYSALLFDFQAHGESPGKVITFGYLESRDATAAVNFMRQKLPAEKLGIIGISMGGAAALLARPPLPVNAMVLESTYPTIYLATEDRLAARFGWLGKLATPLLLCQLKPRLGIGLEDLKPEERARTIPIPKFFIAGTTDRNTTIEESKAMFAAAAGPKQSWWVDGAAHVDLCHFAPAEYKKRVLAFLAANLR